MFRETLLCPTLCLLSLDTGNHLKESGSVFFVPSTQVLIDIDKIPKSLFARLNDSNTLSISSQVRYFIALITLGTPKLDLFSRSLCVLLGGLEVGTALQM